MHLSDYMDQAKAEYLRRALDVCGGHRLPSCWAWTYARPSGSCRMSNLHGAGLEEEQAGFLVVLVPMITSP